MFPLRNNYCVFFFFQHQKIPKVAKMQTSEESKMLEALEGRIPLEQMMKTIGLNSFVRNVLQHLQFEDLVSLREVSMTFHEFLDHERSLWMTHLKQKMKPFVQKMKYYTRRRELQPLFDPLIECLCDENKSTTDDVIVTYEAIKDMISEEIITRDYYHSKGIETIEDFVVSLCNNVKFLKVLISLKICKVSNLEDHNRNMALVEWSTSKFTHILVLVVLIQCSL